MALHRLGLCWLCVLPLLAGCNNQNPEGRTPPVPSVEVSADTTAVADVDKRATLALKQDLVTRFAQNTPSVAVEAGLGIDGFDCAQNPAAPSERACLRAVREGQCEVNTIVRTSPYAPEKAQVIKICEVGATTPAP